MTEKKPINPTGLSVWAGVMIAAIAAVPACLTAIYSNRVVEKKVDTVHELVNSRMTAMSEKADSLTRLVAELRGEMIGDSVKAHESRAVSDRR